MTENNKFVYLVEVDYDTRIEGNDMHSHNVLGVYEDRELAIEQAMYNADSDLDTDDVRDALENEGEVDIWWHPMKVGEHFAKRVRATITEHVLITRTKKDS